LSDRPTLQVDTHPNGWVICLGVSVRADMVSLSQELLREFPAIEPVPYDGLQNIEWPEVHVALEGAKGPPPISFPAPISDW
jgi:hypothetical protein